MKIVAIQGSPHRGNTYDRVERLGETLRGLGDVEFEHVALKDVRLDPCRGCFQCFSRGEDACPLDDDRAELERKMLGADAVIFATPVYSMHVSYLLKTFVDRFAYTFHRPRYFGKYAAGLAVTGAIGLKEALQYVRMFAGSWGFEYVDDLRYVDPPLNSGLPPMLAEADRTEEVARRLCERVRERAPRRLSRNDHLHFHAMRAVYSRLEAFAPVDYAYWKEKGWLEPGARYFMPDARAGFLKGLFGRLVALLMGRSIDRALRGSQDEAGAGEE
jgi:NAD(P)H-dependent FMN reductase